MSKYNTNLAAEFWVLSALYRIGVEAHLTLGNKKAIDIVIVKDTGVVSTVEVKGLAKQYDWPADNIKEFGRPNHIYVFVCFNNQIQDPSSSPSAWIIPATELQQFIVHYKTRSVVSRKLIKELGYKYKNAWSYISEEALSL